MTTFEHCQALVLSQPGEQLCFIGRTGEPLVSEDVPGELFDWLRLAPLVPGIWLWQGRVAYGDEETMVEVGSAFRHLTEDESIAWTSSNRMPWDPPHLSVAAGQAEYLAVMDRYWVPGPGSLLTHHWPLLTDDQRREWCEAAARRTNPEAPNQ